MVQVQVRVPRSGGILSVQTQVCERKGGVSASFCEDFRGPCAPGDNYAIDTLHQPGANLRHCLHACAS